MMLGSLILPREAGEDAADRLLAQTAARLAAEGVPVAGAVQAARRSPEGARSEMRLALLAPPGGEVVISQSLGGASTGCRLDPGALEEAAQRVADALPGARLLLLSKFGKQEAAGRGFRPVVAEAMGLGLPVLVSVSPDVAAEFAAFTEGMAEAVAPEDAEDWCRAALREAGE